MNITDIKIRKLLSEGRLKAIVSITLNDELAVHDIKVIEGPSRLFVAMPSRRDDNGVFRDIVHPISAGGRAEIESQVLRTYEEYRDLHCEESSGAPIIQGTPTIRQVFSGGRNPFGEAPPKE